MLASSAWVPAAPADPALTLHVPEDDCPDPEISIVVPALNEALTIGDFIDWCRLGVARAGVRAEILIIDSSSDDTGRIALARGARVLRVPKLGLGRAYIDAQPFIRGQFVILGDCDCTYDFRELTPFVDAWRAGHEFVMGSRFLGSIEDGAMPALHRYFGTPLTTWILNRLFSSRFSDIHCGMRGLTRDAFLRLGLRSQSWEYASEMIIKSIHLQLRTAEVPIHFLKDREGRQSHHKRAGWLSPWRAGWINLRAMLVHGADFFLVKPGWLLLTLGLLLALPLLGGPIALGPVTFSLNWMLAGTTLATLGLQCIYTGIFARILHDPQGEVLGRWLRAMAYDRTMLLCGAAMATGVGLCLPLVLDYVNGGLRLGPLCVHNYVAVGGLLLAIQAFMTFTFSLVLHAFAAQHREPA